MTRGPTIEEFAQATLDAYRAKFEAGHLPNLCDAIIFCTLNKLPLPGWVADAVIDLIWQAYNSKKKGGLGASGGWRSRYTADYAHFVRWHMVQIRFHYLGIKPTPGRAKKGQDSAGSVYEEVSQSLIGKFAAATWEQVRDSWRLVDKARASGKDQRFRFDFPETIPAAIKRGSNRNR
jgi:hypothetical protein